MSSVKVFLYVILYIPIIINVSFPGLDNNKNNEVSIKVLNSTVDSSLQF